MNALPQNVEQLLQKWNGGTAKLWYYGVSLSRLIIRIEKEGVRGNLHITCSPCLSIMAPVLAWKDCKLDMSIIKEDELLGATFGIADESANVKIECMGVYLQENVDPVF